MAVAKKKKYQPPPCPHCEYVFKAGDVLMWCEVPGHDEPICAACMGCPKTPSTARVKAIAKDRRAAYERCRLSA
jgi:hypothetical protein